MPDSFFKKLNTLVQGHINNVIDPIDEKTSKSRRKALSRQDIRGGLQKDVKLLRQRIDDALAYETELQAKADKLYGAISEWDDKANQAVGDERENDARYALGQMQQTQRELEMIEADLQEHRTITQELISQVNMLDSTIQAVEDEVTTETPTASEQPNVEEIGAQIVQQLDNTRQNLSNLISEYTSKVMGDDAPMREDEDTQDNIPIQRTRTVKHPVDKDKVEDEYSARLSRLSKPDDKK